MAHWKKLYHKREGRKRGKIRKFYKKRKMNNNCFFFGMKPGANEEFKKIFWLNSTALSLIVNSSLTLVSFTLVYTSKFASHFYTRPSLSQNFSWLWFCLFTKHFSRKYSANHFFMSFGTWTVWLLAKSSKKYLLWFPFPNEQQPCKSCTNLFLYLQHCYQGGPGASGVGYGNFEECGPLDLNLNRRNTSWTGLAHTIFVDNPVGSGYR